MRGDLIQLPSQAPRPYSVHLPVRYAGWVALLLEGRALKRSVEFTSNNKICVVLAEYSTLSIFSVVSQSNTEQRPRSRGVCTFTPQQPSSTTYSYSTMAEFTQKGDASTASDASTATKQSSKGGKAAKVKNTSALVNAIEEAQVDELYEMDDWGKRVIRWDMNKQWLMRRYANLQEVHGRYANSPV